jgi:hypothetical protein
MVTSRRIHRLDRSYLDDRFRRISPVAAHSGDRLLSEPTAGTQPCRREPLFMPHFGHSSDWDEPILGEPIIGSSLPPSHRLSGRKPKSEYRYFETL